MFPKLRKLSHAEKSQSNVLIIHIVPIGFLIEFLWEENVYIYTIEIVID